MTLQFKAKAVMRLASLAVIAGALVGTAAMAQDKKQLSVATGTTGGVYYPLGGAVANILTKKVPGWAVTAEATAGAVANLHMIRDGKAEIAFVQADSSFDAAKGQDKFVGKPVDHRALLVIYPNLVHVVTVEATGIKTVADLKGKRVSTGAPVSATEVLANRLLEAAGLSEKDLKRERLAPAESTAAIKDGKLDAYFFAGGPPIAAVADLAASPGMKFRFIEHADLIPKVVAKYGPLYAPVTIKAKTYIGQETDHQSMGVWNTLVVPTSMSDQDAYAITKTLWESYDDLYATHKAVEYMVTANQKQSNSPVPFHAGAVKYFTEKGIKLN